MNFNYFNFREIIKKDLKESREVIKEDLKEVFEKESKPWLKSEIIISIASVLVALAALNVSLFQSIAIREHQKLSVQPTLFNPHNIFPTNEDITKGYFFIDLKNEGVGRAGIYSVAYFYEDDELQYDDSNKNKDRLRTKFKEMFPKDFSKIKLNTNIFEIDNFNERQVIGSKGIIPVISAKPRNEEDAPRLYPSLLTEMGKLGMIYCYNSTYNEGNQLVYGRNNIPEKELTSKYSFCKSKAKDKGLDLKFPDQKQKSWLKQNWYWLLSLTVFFIIGCGVGLSVSSRKRKT